MKPWPHTTVTFVSSGEAPGHTTRDVLVNGSPVTVEEGTVDISQPANNDVQRVTLTLLPDAVYFIGPDEDTPAPAETARNGDLSDDEQAPTDPPTRERAPEGDLDEALAKAEAERDEFNGFWKQALADVRKAREERDDWRAKHDIALANQEAADEALGEELARSQALGAKHAALREDVEACRNACQIEDILDRDDARTPQDARLKMDPDRCITAACDYPEPHDHGFACGSDCPCGEARQADPDTVTLPREDVEAMLRAWEERDGRGSTACVRAALGWGDKA